MLLCRPYAARALAFLGLGLGYTRLFVPPPPALARSPADLPEIGLQLSNHDDLDACLAFALPMG